MFTVVFAVGFWSRLILHILDNFNYLFFALLCVLLSSTAALTLLWKPMTLKRGFFGQLCEYAAAAHLPNLLSTKKVNLLRWSPFTPQNSEQCILSLKQSSSVKQRNQPTLKIILRLTIHTIFPVQISAISENMFFSLFSFIQYCQFCNYCIFIDIYLRSISYQLKMLVDWSIHNQLKHQLLTDKSGTDGTTDHSYRT